MNFDEIDKKLLTYLQDDASLSMAALAEQVGISKSACWRRVQRLEDTGVIQARVTVLDAAKVGLKLVVFISIRTNQHNKIWERQFRNVVATIPEIMDVYRMGGEVDYLIKAVVEDIAGYDALYQRLIHADLFEVTAGFVMETIKQSHSLPLRSIF